MNKLADELILKARAALVSWQTMDADLYHRAATLIAQDEAKLAEWDAWSEKLGHDPYCNTQDWDHQDYVGETLDDPERPCSCHLSTMPTRGA